MTALTQQREGFGGVRAPSQRLARTHMPHICPSHQAGAHERAVPSRESGARGFLLPGLKALALHRCQLVTLRPFGKQRNPNPARWQAGGSSSHPRGAPASEITLLLGRASPVVFSAPTSVFQTFSWASPCSTWWVRQTRSSPQQVWSERSQSPPATRRVIPFL